MGKERDEKPTMMSRMEGQINSTNPVQAAWARAYIGPRRLSELTQQEEETPQPQENRSWFNQAWDWLTGQDEQHKREMEENMRLFEKGKAAPEAADPDFKKNIARGFEYGKDETFTPEKVGRGVASGALKVNDDKTISRGYADNSGNWQFETVPIAKFQKDGTIKSIKYGDIGAKPDADWLASTPEGMSAVRMAGGNPFQANPMDSPNEEELFTREARRNKSAKDNNKAVDVFSQGMVEGFTRPFEQLRSIFNPGEEWHATVSANRQVDDSAAKWKTAGELASAVGPQLLAGMGAASAVGAIGKAGAAIAANPWGMGAIMAAPQAALDFASEVASGENIAGAGLKGVIGVGTGAIGGKIGSVASKYAGQAIEDGLMSKAVLSQAGNILGQIGANLGQASFEMKKSMDEERGINKMIYGRDITPDFGELLIKNSVPMIMATATMELLGGAGDYGKMLGAYKEIKQMKASPSEQRIDYAVSKALANNPSPKTEAQKSTIVADMRRRGFVTNDSEEQMLRSKIALTTGEIKMTDLSNEAVRMASHYPNSMDITPDIAKEIASTIMQRHDLVDPGTQAVLEAFVETIDNAGIVHTKVKSQVMGDADYNPADDMSALSAAGIMRKDGRWEIPDESKATPENTAAIDRIESYYNILRAGEDIDARPYDLPYGADVVKGELVYPEKVTPAQAEEISAAYSAQKSSRDAELEAYTEQNMSPALREHIEKPKEIEEEVPVNLREVRDSSKKTEIVTGEDGKAKLVQSDRELFAPDTKLLPESDVDDVVIKGSATPGKLLSDEDGAALLEGFNQKIVMQKDASPASMKLNAELVPEIKRLGGAPYIAKMYESVVGGDGILQQTVGNVIDTIALAYEGKLKPAWATETNPYAKLDMYVNNPSRQNKENKLYAQMDLRRYFNDKVQMISERIPDMPVSQIEQLVSGIYDVKQKSRGAEDFVKKYSTISKDGTSTFKTSDELEARWGEVALPEVPAPKETTLVDGDSNHDTVADTNKNQDIVNINTSNTPKQDPDAYLELGNIKNDLVARDREAKFPENPDDAMQELGDIKQKLNTPPKPPEPTGTDAYSALKDALEKQNAEPLPAKEKPTSNDIQRIRDESRLAEIKRMRDEVKTKPEQSKPTSDDIQQARNESRLAEIKRMRDEVKAELEQERASAKTDEDKQRIDKEMEDLDNTAQEHITTEAYRETRQELLDMLDDTTDPDLKEQLEQELEALDEEAGKHLPESAYKTVKNPEPTGITGEQEKAKPIEPFAAKDAEEAKTPADKEESVINTEEKPDEQASETIDDSIDKRETSTKDIQEEQPVVTKEVQTDIPAKKEKVADPVVEKELTSIGKEHGAEPDKVVSTDDAAETIAKDVAETSSKVKKAKKSIEETAAPATPVEKVKVTKGKKKKGEINEPVLSEAEFEPTPKNKVKDTDPVTSQYATVNSDWNLLNKFMGPAKERTLKAKDGLTGETVSVSVQRLDNNKLKLKWDGSTNPEIGNIPEIIAYFKENKKTISAKDKNKIDPLTKLNNYTRGIKTGEITINVGKKLESSGTLNSLAIPYKGVLRPIALYGAGMMAEDDEGDTALSMALKSAAMISLGRSAWKTGKSIIVKKSNLGGGTTIITKAKDWFKGKRDPVVVDSKVNIDNARKHIDSDTPGISKAEKERMYEKMLESDKEFGKRDLGILTKLAHLDGGYERDLQHAAITSATKKREFEEAADAIIKDVNNFANDVGTDVFAAAIKTNDDVYTEATTFLNDPLKRSIKKEEGGAEKYSDEFSSIISRGNAESKMLKYLDGDTAKVQQCMELYDKMRDMQDFVSEKSIVTNAEYYYGLDWKNKDNIIKENTERIDKIDAEIDKIKPRRDELRKSIATSKEYRSGTNHARNKLLMANTEFIALDTKLDALRAEKKEYAGILAQYTQRQKMIDMSKQTQHIMDRWALAKKDGDFGLSLREVSIGDNDRITKIHPNYCDPRFKEMTWHKDVDARAAVEKELIAQYDLKPDPTMPDLYSFTKEDGTIGHVMVNNSINRMEHEGRARFGFIEQKKHELQRLMRPGKDAGNIKREVLAVLNEIHANNEKHGIDDELDGISDMDGDIEFFDSLKDDLVRASTQKEIEKVLARTLDYMFVPKAGSYRPNQNIQGYKPKDDKAWIRMWQEGLSNEISKTSNLLSNIDFKRELEKQIQDHQNFGQYNDYFNYIIKTQQSMDESGRGVDYLKRHNTVAGMVSTLGAAEQAMVRGVMIYSPRIGVKNLAGGATAGLAIIDEFGLKGLNKGMIKGIQSIKNPQKNPYKPGDILYDIYDKTLHYDIRNATQAEALKNVKGGGKVLKKALDAGYIFIKKTEEMNRHMAAVTYSANFVKEHPFESMKQSMMDMLPENMRTDAKAREMYVDYVAKSAGNFSAKVNAMYETAYKSDLELMFTKKVPPEIGKLFLTLQTPAINQTILFADLAHRAAGMKDKTAIKALASVGAMAMMASLAGGIENVPFLTDAFNTVDWLMGNGKDKSAQKFGNTPGIKLKLEQEVRNMMKASGYSEGAIDFISMTYRKGLLSAMTNVDFGNSGAVAEMFVPFVAKSVSEIISKDYYKLRTGDIQNIAEAFLRHLPAVNNMTRASLQLASGKDFDTHGEQLNKSYGIGDFVKESLLSESASDKLAKDNLFSKAPTTWTSQGKFDFMDKLTRFAGVGFENATNDKMEEAFKKNKHYTAFAEDMENMKRQMYNSESVKKRLEISENSLSKFMSERPLDVRTMSEGNESKEEKTFEGYNTDKPKFEAQMSNHMKNYIEAEINAKIINKYSGKYGLSKPGAYNEYDELVSPKSKRPVGSYPVEQRPYWYAVTKYYEKAERLGLKVK